MGDLELEELSSMSRLLALTVALCIVGCCHAADPKPKINEITAVIKTFERPACLAKLLTSIQQNSPGLKVIVVDDGQDAAANRREITANAGLVIQYFVLDHDTGIAAARNFAISKVKTKYVVIMDDDFVMTSESKLTDLAAVAGKVHGIAGGELYVHPEGLPDMPFLGSKDIKRVAVSAATLLSLNPKQKSLSSSPERAVSRGTGCIQASMVTTFWVAETSMFEKLKWDEQFKLNEAEDFFLRAQELRIPVHYCNKVKAMHDGQCTTADGQDAARYKRKRERGLYYSKKFFEKWNIMQHSTAQGGMFFKTCAFGKDKSDCGVAHMWKRDELKMCDKHGDCSEHKVKIDKKPGTKKEGLFKCDASGKCDVPVIH